MEFNIECSEGEVEDCNRHCAPNNWVGDSYCDDGDYESENGNECVSCPTGSTCGEGTTIENMEVDGGYWRVDGESDTILQCPVPEACVGSSSNSSSFDILSFFIRCFTIFSRSESEYHPGNR